MKGFIKLFILSTFLTLVLSVVAFAKINITADDISGDDNLKSMALSLPSQDGEIAQNAVYVATDGVNATGYGTMDKPYATVDYAIQKIPSPKTVIYVRGGVYDQKIAFRASGTAENYLTVKAYPGEKPIFETSSTGRIIDPNKNNYIYIDGLTLKSKTDKVIGSTHGVEMTEGHHIIFRNMEIYNINVPDPTSSSVSTHAFNLYGSNASVPISNILIENCNIHDMQTGWSEALTVNGNSEYVSVINCRIADIGNIGLDFAGNFGACKTAALDQARYCVARGNVVSNCISPNARSYGLYNDGGRDNIFDRNEVYGCSGGIEIGSEEGGKSGKQDVKNIKITNNYVHDNIEIGIAVGGYSITNSSVGYVYNVKVYNNTLVNNDETDIVINKSDNLDYRNNIIYSKLPANSNSSYKNSIRLSFSSEYITNLNFANNIYYSPDGVNAFCFRNNDIKVFGVENWIDKTGKFTDPLFATGGKLSAGSPAIDFADQSVVADLGSYDAAEAPRINGTLDAGCFEYHVADNITVCGVPMAKEKITLYGDTAFIQEILKGSSSIIAADAIYVSPNGSDTNTGTIDAPFKTVQKALDTVKAGQTIYLREGTYTALNTFKSSGTEGNYITLRNYPGEKPYLTMTAGSDGAILHLDGNAYIKIEGLEIGGLSSVIAQGILLDGNENHVIIRNNDIHNLLTTKPGENENGEANAILCYGEGKTEEDAINNICIENNLVHNNTTGWCESVSVTGNAKYINIINNTVYENTNIGIDFYGNAGYCSVPALDQPRYGVAAGNIIYKSICSYAECAGLYVDGARDIVLENNIIYDSMYGIEIGSEELQADYPVKNIIARNNLVYNNSAGGIRVGGYDKKATGYVMDTKIYNNTLVNNGEGEGGWNGELCFVKCNGIDVRNNIVYKENTEYPMIGGDLAKEYVLNVNFSNNVFYSPLGADEIYFEFAKGSATGIAEFNAQTGGSDTFGQPEFNADYSLQSGSYGIDIGSSDVVSYMGSYTDLANNYRVINTIDVGAFEYQDGSMPTVATTTTETTTGTVSEDSTETTTMVVGSSSTWNFTDGSWADKTTGKTLYVVNGLSVYHNGSYNSTMGFKFDKNTKAVKTEGFYIGLNAEKNDKITVFVNYNSSKAGNYVGLSLAKVEGTDFIVKASDKVEATKNGTYSISFTVPEDGEYIIYTDDNSSGSAYYNKVVLEKTAKEGDFNLDGNVDVKDVADMLRHASQINVVTNEDSLKNGDLNSDNKVDILDAANLLKRLSIG